MADIVQLEEKGNLLYPKTHSSAVDGLQANLNDITQKMQAKVTDKALWSGTWYGGKGQITTPSKPLSSCVNGWILQWEVFTNTSVANGTGFQFTYIPKQFALYHSGKGVVCPLKAYNGTNAQVKYLYIDDKKLLGHENNAPDSATAGTGNKMYVLTKIYEY